MKTILWNQKGFTALEMMIAVALSAMIFYSIFTVMRVGDDQIEQTQTKMLIQDSARIGLNKMIEEIRQSAPARIQINGNGNTLQFQIPNPGAPVDNAFDIDWANSWSITYALGGINNNQLVRTNATTGQTSVLANDVQGVTFTGNAANPTIVTINLNVQRALIDGTLIPAAPLSMSARAEIRNT